MRQIDLKQFRKLNGLSQKELADYLGIGQGFVSQIEKGDRPLPQGLYEKIIANPEWVVNIDTIENHGNINVGSNRPDADMLPLIPIDAIAGPGMPVITDEQVQDYYMVGEFRNADFMIRVKGDSMSPKYAGGDLLACKVVKDVLFFQYGRVYVLYTESQGVMIKRIEPAPDPNNVLCASENPKYGGFEVPKSDIVSVALVVGSISLE